MEIDGPVKDPEGRILDAMEAAEPSQATAVLAQLTSDLHSKGVNGVNLTGMWTSFKKLLHRRGYYVGTHAQVIRSLDEIEQVGEGFDLFDLARTLARYDTVRMECCGLTDHRSLPELRRFSPSCACAHHHKES